MRALEAHSSTGVESPRGAQSVRRGTQMVVACSLTGTPCPRHMLPRVLAVTMVWWRAAEDLVFRDLCVMSSTRVEGRCGARHGSAPHQLGR